VLRIVGDGPERDRLYATADDLRIRDCVEFVGPLPPEDIAGQLQWADIFAFSSAAEGRPNAILEAMAAGLPIIATDIPGVRELIAPDAGLLFPVGDAAALADGIRHLSAHPAEARALGQAARARIEASNLTWAACAGRYTALYADAAGRQGIRPCAG
jgi:glycosyltransferase involved in cell wall biosynthesis